MTNGVEIRAEQPGDRALIEQVHRAAFPTAEEALLVAALRDQGAITASLVALADGKLVGHILFSRLTIGAGADGTPGVALAPIAVQPAFQRQGIGSALIRAGLAVCRDQGERLAIVLGDPNYYGRFGFSAALAAPLKSIYAGPAFQVAELQPNAMRHIRGPVHYAEPFAAL